MIPTKEYWARVIGSMLVMTLFFAAFQTTFAVSASSPIDVDKKCSLTVTYQSGETAYANQEIQLYRVAEVNADCRFSPTSAFEACHMELNGITSQTQWNTVTETFAAHITADSITPDSLTKTDTDGKAVFQNLPTGLYLVREVRITEPNAVKVFHNFMVCLPHSDANGDWVYDVAATPKFEEYAPTYQTVRYRLSIYWNDTGLEYNRPKMLRVKILRNGELVKIITLTAEDNWTYEWTAPDDGSVWEVVSEEVSNYTITMWRNENHFITEYHTTGTSDDALSSAAESPIRGYSPGTGEDIDPLIAVVPMTISGMFLILFGILSRKRAQEDE